MIITFKNKTITSTNISAAETAWHITDYVIFLEYIKNLNKIVLGGDILTNKLDYTYDNWYYNPNPYIDNSLNSNHSIDVALNYISRYIDTNGSNYYVVFVVEDMIVF